MTLETAIDLIKPGVNNSGSQSWADLGAGDGMFTKALSKILSAGSSIIAVDRKPSLISIAENIRLQIKTGDFTKLDFDDTDGIVMANSLHYVKDQLNFLVSLRKKTKRLIVVEYNTDRGNQWVPYPVSFNKLATMVNATKLAEAPSAYHREGIYSALVVFS